jgi:hypothetical protein
MEVVGLNYVITLMASGFLVFAYSFILARVGCSGYSVIRSITALLLISNVCTFTMIFCTLRMNNEGLSMDAFFHWNVAANSFWAMQDLTFCEAHWTLAFIYFKVARNIPQLVQQAQSSTPDSVQTFRMMNFAGTAVNGLLPILEGVLLIWFTVRYFNSGYEPTWLVYGCSAAVVLTNSA